MLRESAGCDVGGVMVDLGISDALSEGLSKLLSLKLKRLLVPVDAGLIRPVEL